MSKKPSNNIVDDWLKSSEGSLPFVDDEVGPTGSAINNAQTQGRVGLGFESGSQKVDSGRSKENALLHRLDKSNKKRKHQQDQASDSSFVPSLNHGVMDNDADGEYESRAMLVSSGSAKPCAQQSKKAKVAAPVQPPVVTAPTPAPVVATPSAQADQTGSASGSAKKHGKRTKTRSKQKNIRKDNRADNMKPSHLLPGAKDYRGRPVTMQTKNVLTRPTSAP